jgi:hypothetical protein
MLWPPCPVQASTESIYRSPKYGLLWLCELAFLRSNSPLLAEPSERPVSSLRSRGYDESCGQQAWHARTSRWTAPTPDCAQRSRAWPMQEGEVMAAMPGVDWPAVTDAEERPTNFAPLRARAP